ncbi:MAG: type II toxin-antitoxin system HipA family toxin [Candidatus Goldiibacteriota bacterium]
MTARRLEVYLYDKKTGILEDNGSELIFRYDAGADAPLSIRMPVREKEYRDKECRPFFENLLPEGNMRVLVAQKERVSPENVFSLLDKIGGDCAGAVSLYEEGTAPETDTGREPEEINNNSLYEIIRSQQNFPLLTGKNIRLSLAGAQSKFAVYISGGKMYYPGSGFFSSHLIKPENSSFKSLAVNEFFCMELAGRMKITAPKVQLKKVRDKTYLVISRYDRMHKNGERKRIHQEDLCQALGCLPGRKYQKEGGPGIKDCYGFLRNETAIPSLENFMSVIIFNYLAGNCDAHAKNFSILHNPSEAEVYALAPFYDIVSTEVYESLSKEMAMKTGSAWDIREVQKSDFYKTAAELNIKEKEMDRLIKKFSGIAEKSAVLSREIKEMGFDNEICEKITESIKNRLDRLYEK